MAIKELLTRVFRCHRSRRYISLKDYFPVPVRKSLHIIFMICILVAVITILVKYGGTESNIARIVRWVVSILTSILGLYSIVRISCSFYTAYSERQFDPSKDIKLCFLWFLCLFVVLLESLYMFIDFECLFSPLFLFLLVLSYRSCFILFTFGQVVLISYFKTCLIIPAKKIGPCLVIIIGANLTLWFVALIGDESGRFLPSYVSTLSNDSMFFDELSCFWNSKAQNLITTLLPILIPAKLEFGLFSGCFIMSIRYVITHKNEVVESQRTRLETLERNRESNQSSIYIIIYILGIILSFPSILISLVVFNDECSPFDADSSVQTVLAIVETVNTCLQLFTIIAGYFRSRTLAEASWVLWKKDSFYYMLLISTVGSIIYVSIGLLLLFSAIEDSVQEHNLPFHCRIFKMICFTLQTYLIHKLRKLSSFQRLDYSIAYICLLLSLVNFNDWLKYSFTNMRKQFSLQHTFLGQTAGKLVQEISFSFVIFYKLISCIELYKLYRIFQR